MASPKVSHAVAPQSQPKCRAPHVFFDGKDIGQLESFRVKSPASSMPLAIGTARKSSLDEGYKYYEYDPSDSSDSVLADVVKGIRAVAYLMVSLVDGGRENNLDAATAQGFADTLREYARRADDLINRK